MLIDPRLCCGLPSTRAILWCCCYVGSCLSCIVILVPSDFGRISILPPLEILWAIDLLGVVRVMVGVEWEFGMLVDASRDEGSQLNNLSIVTVKTSWSILPVCSAILARQSDELCANLSDNCHSGCEHPWLLCQYLDRNLCRHSLL